MCVRFFCRFPIRSFVRSFVFYARNGLPCVFYSLQLERWQRQQPTCGTNGEGLNCLNVYVCAHRMSIYDFCCGFFRSFNLFFFFFCFTIRFSLAKWPYGDHQNQIVVLALALPLRPYANSTQLAMRWVLWLSPMPSWMFNDFDVGNFGDSFWLSAVVWVRRPQTLIHSIVLCRI